MTYRQPAFMVDNAIGDITDVGDVRAAPSTSAISTETIRALVDGRISSIGTFTATGSNAGLRYDLPVVPPVELNRMVIPATHSGFNGETLQIFHDNAVGFPSATTASSAVVSGEGTIDRVLDSGTEQFWAMQVSTSVNLDVFTLRGLWLGVYNQLSSAAAVDPKFELGWESQQTETDYPGGTAVAQISAPRRTFTLEIADVDPAGADYTLLDAVMQARTKPFWYWPPDDTDPGPFYVRHSRDPSRVQDFGAPSLATRYTFKFGFLEDNL